MYAYGESQCVITSYTLSTLILQSAFAGSKYTLTILYHDSSVTQIRQHSNVYNSVLILAVLVFRRASDPLTVFVAFAGPQALYADIKDVCASINKGPIEQGKPYLSVHRQAYNL